MSRGGFGGGGRGGRSGPPGVPMFGGDDLKPDYSVSELFPPQPPTIQSTLTKPERHTVSRFRSHRHKIHIGPMYTVLTSKRSATDAFNDIAKYSSRYTRQVRKAPKLDSRPYVFEFFPEELGDVMGRGEGGRKELVVRRIDAVGVLEDVEFNEDEDEEGKKKEEGVEEEGRGEEEGEEEEMDEFDDDDEGDYNAEQYFDDGDDIEDFGDDDGGGDYY